MITIEERQQLKKMLYQGSGKLIAGKIGVTTNSISNWLSGKTNSKKVETAVLDFFLEEREVVEQKLKASGLLV